MPDCKALQRDRIDNRPTIGRDSSMTIQEKVANGSAPEALESLIQAARNFVPAIQAKALEMESARRLDGELIAAMNDAGLFSILVPKSYGGSGLGLRDLNRLLEIIGGADLSTAWVFSFYAAHNWLLCRFPQATQEELYDGRSSVLCAAVWAPAGKAEPTAGGYRVSGRWGYASGIHHADMALVPAVLGDGLSWFIVPKSQLTVTDDWHMGHMAATGSATISADAVYVREGWAMKIQDLVSASKHGGTYHPEAVYGLSFGVALMSGASMCLGALDRAIELTRDKLSSSKPNGMPRLERTTCRMRWIEAVQTARAVRLVRDGAFEELLLAAERGGARTPEEEASPGMHSLWIGRMIREALRSLLDGFGTSSYKVADELRRMTGDAAMMTTHVLGGDYDVQMERHSRWTLGLGPAAGDPIARIN